MHAQRTAIYSTLPLIIVTKHGRGRWMTRSVVDVTAPWQNTPLSGCSQTDSRRNEWWIRWWRAGEKLPIEPPHSRLLVAGTESPTLAGLLQIAGSNEDICAPDAMSTCFREVAGRGAIAEPRARQPARPLCARSLLAACCSIWRTRVKGRRRVHDRWLTKELRYIRVNDSRFACKWCVTQCSTQRRLINRYGSREISTLGQRSTLTGKNTGEKLAVSNQGA